MLEILAHRSQVIDAFVPFLARGRTFYIGLGTIASDLVVLLIVTGIARGRFAARWPWTWRAIHATAYLCWPLSIVHGLLAGRTAKPYVDWSYGACLAAVGLALIIRLVATLRGGRETAAHPLPDRGWPPVPAGMPAVPQEQPHNMRAAAVPRAGRVPRALPPGASPGPAPSYTPGTPHLPQGTPYLAARRYSPPHPNQPGHPSGPWQYRPPEPSATRRRSRPPTRQRSRPPTRRGVGLPAGGTVGLPAAELSAYPPAELGLPAAELSACPPPGPGAEGS